MNEVRPTHLSPPVVNRAASSQGADTAKELPFNGKELPVKDVISETLDPEKTVATKIEVVVTEINEYVQSVQRDLHFSVDEDSGITIIRVRDKESGELIRQIPEDIFLNLAQNLKDNQALHLLDAHG